MRIRRHLLALPLLLSAGGAAASDATAVRVLDQGWSHADRQAFYTTSQGSRIMPWSWFRALERAGSQELFLADKLARYGYLPNDDMAYNRSGLPVGFALDQGKTTTYVGMTCAACHTGQIEYKGMHLRVDGAPGGADFQAFLTDLTRAMEETGRDPAKFNRFARRVLGSAYGDKAAGKLLAEFNTVTKRDFTDFFGKALPANHWGPFRLDAFGMIFNRLAGLDLNKPDNVTAADAPVSYPFLWNAHQQDVIQWNQAAPNGDMIKALARNTGEVIGVFGKLEVCREGKNAHGQSCGSTLGRIAAKTIARDVAFYNSSVSLGGLWKLEEKVACLWAPPWPSDVFGPINRPVAAKGKDLFDQACRDCHNMQPEKLAKKVWEVKTDKPIDTDPTMWLNSQRKVETGILEGSWRIPLGKMKKVEAADVVLANAVIGTIVDGVFHPNGRPLAPDVRKSLGGPTEQESYSLVAQGKPPTMVASVGTSFASRPEIAAAAVAPPDAPAAAGKPQVDPAAAKPIYEARPLFGVWATAPYLHNGSVANLWELLKPEDRQPVFAVGSRRFDPVKVGYVPDGSAYEKPLDTKLPGNGNFGHDDYRKADGSALTDEDRWAIIEYMKTLDQPANYRPKCPAN